MPARNQIEARVLQIVDRVVRGGRAEDFLVECKAEWPDPEQVGRQLAGHCNAARGEPVLWIIGLDEDGHAVRTLDNIEPASWWGQVEKRFTDGVTPDLVDVVMDTEHGSVVALHLETDRSPYLVTPKQGGDVEREVPWRSGTRTRSAKRHEVLSLLLPAAQTPEISLLNARCSATYRAEAQESPYGDEPAPAGVSFIVEAQIFITATARVMLPEHLWRINLTGVSERADPVALPEVIFFRPTGTRRQERSDEPPYGVGIHSSGLYVNGPDLLTVIAKGTLSTAHRLDVSGVVYLSYDLVMPVAGSERASRCSGRLISRRVDSSPQAAGVEALGTWRQLEND